MRYDYVIKHTQTLGDLFNAPLFKTAERESFDLAADWFNLLEDLNIFPAVSPHYFTCTENQEVICIIPLAEQIYKHKIRQITGLSNFYTSLYRPLIKQNISQNQVNNTIKKALSQFKFDQVYFSGMDPEDVSYTMLEKALHVANLKPFRFFCYGNWYLPVNGQTYNEYFNTLLSKTRNTLNRRHKKFFADNRGQQEIIIGGDKLEDAIQIWERIYSKSWKRPEPYPNFMPALMRMLAERGWLRLGIAYYDKQPVAAQLWIVSYGRAAIYKLAYDEAYGHLSPGSVLTAHLMRHALDVDQVKEVDYLVGDDAYKKDWMSHRRERWGIIAFNLYTPAGLAGYLKQWVSQIRKSIVKINKIRATTT